MCKDNTKDSEEKSDNMEMMIRKENVCRQTKDDKVMKAMKKTTSKYSKALKKLAK